jgi:hypothetical protein
MHKIFLTLLILVFMNTLWGQTPKEIERQKLIAKVEQKMEDGVILEFFRKTNEKIKKSIKNNKPLLSIEYKSFASFMNKWMKYRWLIADTGVSKKWLKEVQDMLLYMSKTQGYIEAAKFNGMTNTARYKQAVKYMNVAHKRFFKLMKKTVKVSIAVRQKAQVEKDIWQRSMRKKYNIKKDSWYSF